MLDGHSFELVSVPAVTVSKMVIDSCLLSTNTTYESLRLSTFNL